MKAWLIYTRQDALQNESYIAWFLEEARKQQVDMKLIYRDELHISVQYGTYTLEKNGEVVDTPDFVVVRTIEPIIQKHFEAMAIPTFNNSEVATICNHKARTYIELNQLGIPIMPSYFFTKDSLPTTPPVPFPLVVKSATGRGGNEVYMIHNQTEWESCISFIQAYEVIIQATSHLQLGKDVRVFVIGKEIIAAVLRHNPHDFRANFKLGGSAISFQLTKQMTSLIQTIINHFDFGLVGIDFLLSDDGELVFNEIEDVVGSRILSETSDINLLKEYITFIKNELKKE